MRHLELVDTLRQDLQFALRQLAKSPAFTIVALITLALGIGATTAIFSVVYGVLLKPLPYANSDRIVMLQESGSRGPSGDVTFGSWNDWRTRSTSFEVIGASWGSAPLTLTGAGDPTPIQTGVASAGFWKAMYVPAVAGRYFSEEEDLDGAEPVVVLSYALWQNRFGGDRSLVGRPITLNGRAYTVVGVAPPEYILYPPAEKIWIPLAPPAWRLQDRSDHELTVYGLVRRGVSAERAVRELDRIQATTAAEHPASGVATGVVGRPVAEAIVGPQGKLLYTLLGAVAFVLLIACANVANLLIARATVRRGEIAIRGALGASRRRIIAQLLTESLLLGLCGGALGVAVALTGVRFLVSSPLAIPRLADASVSVPVLVFTLLLSGGCALLFGLFPALRATRVDLQQTLRDGGRAATGTVRERARKALVIGELCLTQVLLVGAVLLIRSALSIQSVSPGFVPANVLATNVILPAARYPTPASHEAVFQQLEEAIAAVPGVQAVGRTLIAPIHGGGYDCLAFPEGATEPDRSATDANVRTADASYFSTLGVPLLRGRLFTRADGANAPPVAIVNRTLARRLFGDADPLGRRVANCASGEEKTRRWHEIVGVVGDVRARGLGEDPPAELYYPTSQFAMAQTAFVIRGSVPVTTLLSAIRRAVAVVDPLLALSKVETMDQAISENLALPRFTMWLLMLLGATGLVLATVGVYGLITYFVTQRKRELGIRIALGATGQSVQWMLIKQGVAFGLAGVVLGSAIALQVTRLLGALVYGVSDHDPVTFSIVGGLLTLIAIAASYLPARRAAHVDALEALRAG
jgi:putative ABC transport system permease protein